MRLLNFVEEHDGVGTSPNLLSELAAFFIADVSGRSADQSRDSVLLHVFGHVEVDHRIRIAEHELAERLGKQRLSDAGGADKEK